MLKETHELLSIPGFLNSLKKSTKQVRDKKTFSMEEVFKTPQSRSKYVRRN